jgi:hypothetical protein
MVNKILFIIKKRVDTDASGQKKLIQTGLYNSSNYLNIILNTMGIESYVDYAIDNNCIDRIVTKHRPTHVIIEALWVVPPKFNILCQLHPKIKWIIRFHSDMPFIACEGIAMSWISKYSMFKNLYIGCNAPRFFREVKVFLKAKNLSDNEINEKVIYLPNYYPVDTFKTKPKEEKDEINICCFGALRPLKNQLIQAISAIEFANKINKKLRYHINATRVETNGLPVYNNIKGLFTELSSDNFELVEHSWYDKEEFLSVCSQMDIGLQVSFSETFNIVGCDMLSQGVPIVCSYDIPWSTNTKYNASPTDSVDITNKLLLTYENIEDNVKLNTESLSEYVEKTKQIWYDYFRT